MSLADAFAQATVPAEDIHRATRFYTEVLGLKKQDVPEQMVAVFEAGNGSSILMYQRPGRTKAEHTAITFTVDDLDAVVDGLTAKGVKFEQYDMGPIKTDARGIADQGSHRIAWLTDPEGNILAILAPKRG
ncbi:MAG TPA: VOC family protein [Thermoanaerobaculia bacterium]|nr:VOC family protein [Thermoanaerobaculia bacterium]